MDNSARRQIQSREIGKVFLFLVVVWFVVEMLSTLTLGNHSSATFSVVSPEADRQKPAPVEIREKAGPGADGNP